MRHLLFAFFFVPAFLQAQTIAQKADELLTAYTNQKKFSGNVLIARKGTILIEKGYGYANIAGRTPNTPQTQFRVGSLTKMFTSALILQLAASHRLSLTDPVSKYIAGFGGGDSIRLIHLLSHTSGIRGTTGDPEPTTLTESVARFHYQAPGFAPGSRFEYNNFNYILLSYIAEKITQVPFAQLVQSEVLNKAGMHHSGLDTKDRQASEKAIGYVTNPKTIEWQKAEEGNVAVAAGAGAVYSTTGDLYQWARSLSANRVVPDSLLAKAQTPILNNYGLGWMMSKKNNRTQLGHTGSIPGFLANFMYFPKEDITIVLLSNYQDADARRLSDDLVSLVFGEPYVLPVQKKEMTLSTDVLSRYAGRYQLPNGFEISVTTEGNKLYAQAQGDPQKIELTAESETKFYLKGPETEIEFLKEGAEVKYMFVNMQGGQKFVRVK